MQAEHRLPLNTLDSALTLARRLSLSLKKKNSKDHQAFRVFSAFTDSEIHALVAFCIWRTKGEIIKELTNQ